MQLDNIYETQKLTREEKDAIAAIFKRHDAQTPQGRLQILNEFVEYLGKSRAKNIGIIFYDADGNVRAYWP